MAIVAGRLLVCKNEKKREVVESKEYRHKNIPRDTDKTISSDKNLNSITKENQSTCSSNTSLNESSKVNKSSERNFNVLFRENETEFNVHKNNDENSIVSFSESEIYIHVNEVPTSSSFTSLSDSIKVPNPVNLCKKLDFVYECVIECANVNSKCDKVTISNENNIPKSENVTHDKVTISNENNTPKSENVTHEKTKCEVKSKEVRQKCYHNDTVECLKRNFNGPFSENEIEYNEYLNNEKKFNASFSESDINIHVNEVPISSSITSLNESLKGHNPVNSYKKLDSVYECVTDCAIVKPNGDKVLISNENNIPVHENEVPIWEVINVGNEEEENNDKSQNNGDKENEELGLNESTLNVTNILEYKIAELNVNGWTKNNCEHRQKILLTSNADLIAINETHLKNNECPYLPGYHWIGANRVSQHINAIRASGGIGLFYKENIAIDFNIKIIDKTHDGILSILFTHKMTEFNMVVTVVYLPPDNSRWGRDSTGFFAHLLSEIYTLENIDLNICLGDLNARIGKWSDIIEDVDDIPDRKYIDENTNNHGASLIEFLQESRMCVLNGRGNDIENNYTSISINKGAAVVDYILVPINDFSQFSEFKVQPCMEIIRENKLQSLIGVKSKPPDHSLLSCKINITHMPSIVRPANSVNAVPQIIKFKVNQIPENFMNSDEALIESQKLLDKIELCRETQDQVNEMYKIFCNTVINEMNRSLEKVNNTNTPTKRFKPRKPYWDEELQNLFQTVVSEERNLRKCTFRPNKPFLRTLYKNARHKFDRVYRKKKRAFSRERLLSLENSCEKNPNKFWEEIRKLGPKRQNDIIMETYDKDGNIVCDPESVLKTWADDFKTLFSINTEPKPSEAKIRERCLDDSLYLNELRMNDPLYEELEILNKGISIEEVRRAVMNTKKKKAVGIDTLPNEVLKNEKVIKLLHKIFEYCFDTGIIPEEWSKGIIKPIPKSRTSDPRIPLNYRGISLISCVAKIFTSILNSRIVSYLDNTGKLNDEQNGFRKDRSCADHIYVLHSIAKDRQTKNLSTYVTFIDFSKAFDCVDRKLLLYILLKSEIEGKMYFIVKALYNLTESCISLNGKLSNWFKTELGVRQGDNLSPTLFSLFINGLAQNIKSLDIGIQIGARKIPILLYADDIILISETPIDMQKMLDEVTEWCEIWQMKINMSKTKLMEIRKSGTEPSIAKFKLANQKIEKCQEYKYLGVYFDEHLNFKKNTEVLSASGQRALGALIAKFKNISDMGYQTFTKLYNSNIAPITDYGSEIWGYTSNSKTDCVQNKAMRIFLGVHKYASIDYLFGDMGWAPSKLRREISMLRYWNRLITMENTRLTKNIFNIEYQLSGHWCKMIGNIFKNIGLYQLYELKQTCNLKLCEEKLLELHSLNWLKQVKNKPKLRSYIQWKDNCCVDKFVSLNLNRSHRSILAQIRSGTLPLEIETGRFKGLKLEERVCKLCDENQIESEVHFILLCKCYRKNREQFFNKIGINLTNYVADTLMKDLFEKFPRAFGKFCNEIYELRKCVLFATNNTIPPDP